MTEPKESKSPWRQGYQGQAIPVMDDEIAERRRQQRAILPDTRKRNRVCNNHERSLRQGFGNR